VDGPLQLVRGHAPVFAAGSGGVLHQAAGDMHAGGGNLGGGGDAVEPHLHAPSYAAKQSACMVQGDSSENDWWQVADLSEMMRGLTRS